MKNLWQDDKLQFARLISEIEANEGFDEELIGTLCGSMDLKPTELMELIDRAQEVFDRAKSNLTLNKKGV